MTPPPFLDGRKEGRKSCTLNPKTSVWSIIMWHSRLQISSNKPFFSKIPKSEAQLKVSLSHLLVLGRRRFQSPHTATHGMGNSWLKKGIFHNLQVLKERTDLKQDFCTNIRGRELRKEKFRPWLEWQASKIQPRARRED